MKTIERCGDQWSVWEDGRLVGVADRQKDAQDMRENWNSRLWPWESLRTIELQAEREARYKHRKAHYMREMY